MNLKKEYLLEPKGSEMAGPKERAEFNFYGNSCANKFFTIAFADGL